MSTTTPIKGGETGRYRDQAGRDHRVRIRQAAKDAWEILDIAGTTVLVIDRLEGPEENDATAAAVAVDWITQRRRYATWGEQGARTA